MKGISEVIATILMLMITLALAGSAYLFINNAFTQQTAVVLGIDEATCVGDVINLVIKNDGTSQTSAVTVKVVNPDGDEETTWACDSDPITAGDQPIDSIGAGQTGACTITRAAEAEAGNYRLTITAAGARSVRGSANCATEVAAPAP
jgi:flagellin-like protein